MTKLLITLLCFKKNVVFHGIVRQLQKKLLICLKIEYIIYNFVQLHQRYQTCNNKRIKQKKNLLGIVKLFKYVNIISKKQQALYLEIYYF